MGPKPLVFALAALAALVASVLFTIPGGSVEVIRATEHELLPDLITLPPADIQIELGQKGRSGKDSKKLLLLSNGVANIGEGPLEMYPVSDDCDGDGNKRNDRLIIQRIFGDTDNSGGFTRTGDQAVREQDVGCSVFHHQHRHWHMEGFAIYELRELVSPYDAVAVSAKVSFCVIDTDLYDAGLVNGNNAYYTQCGRNVDLGLSIGWADVYGYWLDGQSIDITATANGQYCLVSTADPDNGIEEIDETNNIASVLVTIDGNQVTVGAPSCH